ncbi:Vps50 [Linum grandiflorum]
MQPNPFPFGSVLVNPFLFNGDLGELGGAGLGFESSRVFFLLPFLLSQGGGMDLSKVGEKLLSSVRSARSLGLLPPVSDRPEVPARAAAAAAVARAISALPPHQRYSLPSSSEDLCSIYGSRPQDQVVEELEEDFYEENFDPIRHILEMITDEETEVTYFEKQAALRLAQLDRVAEHLSHHVMRNYEVMVKGMNLVRELEKDIKIANIICMNGRRNLTSSMNEVSRDLVVNTSSKKKQALLDIVPILNELRHAVDMQAALESLVEEGNYCKAFQVLSEYLQLLDSLSELSAAQEMSRAVEVWLGRTLQKLDALLLGVCQDFKEESYIIVVDAYALIGDVSGLAEKIQSFFMQEVLSETHSVLKNVVFEDQQFQKQNSRLTYSDLCLQIPESKFRQCLLRTLAALFKLMCSYHEIMSFQMDDKNLVYQTSTVNHQEGDLSEHATDAQRTSDSQVTPESSNSVERLSDLTPAEESISGSSVGTTGSTYSVAPDSKIVNEGRNDSSEASSSGSPWYQLRKDATTCVSQTLQRGRRNIWQLTTSRVLVLLSSGAVGSMSIHQFLKNYEDLNMFILAGEAFSGVEAVEFRQKLKGVCENYFAAFHRQNIYALKMVLEKETWMKLPPETAQVVSFAGLVGDGAPVITQSGRKSDGSQLHLSAKSTNAVDVNSRKSGFTSWLKGGNPFAVKVMHIARDGLDSPHVNGSGGEFGSHLSNHANGTPVSEDENEDLLADFIDEDSQLPSRKLGLPRTNSVHWKNDDATAQTGSSLCLLRSMDKYARLMQKLEIVNVEFFKGICQLFEVFYYFVFDVFGGQNSSSTAKHSPDILNHRLKTALSKISQDCDQWIKPQAIHSASSLPTSSTYTHTDIVPSCPPNHSPASLSLKERCAGADTSSVVARILHRSKAHLQSMLLQKNPTLVEDFYANLVDSVPDLTEHIHRTTARLLLHIDGYVDRIAAAKWEVKELGLEHNGYVDLLLGEFKHYKTRLAHGGIHKEVQDLLLEYGVEIIAATLIEGLSRVKKCTDEGRALMSLDLQVLINGLQHFVPGNVKPKLQTVETFIKAYYLPETEYVHWARAHPEYSKAQVVGLVNLVATMKGWKRKTRLEAIEKIESSC